MFHLLAVFAEEAELVVPEPQRVVASLRGQHSHRVLVQQKQFIPLCVRHSLQEAAQQSDNWPHIRRPHPRYD